MDLQHHLRNFKELLTTYLQLEIRVWHLLHTDSVNPIQRGSLEVRHFECKMTFWHSFSVFQASLVYTFACKVRGHWLNSIWLLQELFGVTSERDIFVKAMFVVEFWSFITGHKIFISKNVFCPVCPKLHTFDDSLATTTCQYLVTHGATVLI